MAHITKFCPPRWKVEAGDYQSLSLFFFGNFHCETSLVVLFIYQNTGLLAHNICLFPFNVEQSAAFMTAPSKLEQVRCGDESLAAEQP